MSEKRRLAIVRRYPLANTAEGWTDEAYLLYRTATYADFVKMSDIDEKNLTQSESIQQVNNFVKEHIVGGKVFTLNEEDKFQLVDYEDGDVDWFAPDVINGLFQAMTGGSLDPKDTPEGATPTSALPDSTAPTTTS